MLIAFSVACAGQIGDTLPAREAASEGEVACGQALELNRLDGEQYRAVITALVPGWSHAATLAVPFAEARRADLFSTWSQRASIGEYEIQDLWTTSDAVASAWTNDSANVCASVERAACVRRVWAPALRLLWSRPATDAELDEITSALAEAETEMTPIQASTTVMRSALMSPRFLYRPEGLDGKMTSHEIAAALSFTLFNRPPDAELQAFAEADALEPEQVRAEVARLLETPSQVPALRRFLRELFQYDGAADSAKDARAYPFHRPAALIADTERVVEQLLEEHARSGLLRALLTSDLVYVRAATAQSWELNATSDDGEFGRDPTRTGVLTHPSWLVTMSVPDHNHIVRRGLFVRERLLCGEVPAIPGGVVPQIPEVPGQTLRQRLAEHSQNPECASCHTLMDPLGVAFESWDHVGRAQTVDNGGDVDPSGELSGAGEGFDGPYADARELMHKLAASPTVKACWVKQLYSFVRGREVRVSDRCELDRLVAHYDATGEDTLALIEHMFSSPEFLDRTTFNAEVRP